MSTSMNGTDVRLGKTLLALHGLYMALELVPGPATDAPRYLVGVNALPDANGMVPAQRLYLERQADGTLEYAVGGEEELPADTVLTQFSAEPDCLGFFYELPR